MQGVRGMLDGSQATIWAMTKKLNNQPQLSSFFPTDTPSDPGYHSDKADRESKHCPLLPMLL